TANGEVWVFNKSYTQYIPLLVYELQVWVGTPSIYVFDCSAAGILLQHFRATDAILLAACGATEVLPMHPSLCADVFTSCLTTPITVALRWFLSQNEKSMGHLEPSVIDRIPVWLDFASPAKPPPPQLPIILQMLLNQALRLRALRLLTAFFELGPYAINLTLNVGIFPYVEKLLQSPAPELRHVLVSIWCKILLLDKSCQVDLVKVHGHAYFLHHLVGTSPVSTSQKIQSLAVLARLCDGYVPAQDLLHPHIGAIIPILTDVDPNVRLWACLVLGKSWEHCINMEVSAASAALVHVAASDPSPSTRAAAVFALGTLCKSQSNGVLLAAQMSGSLVEDASPLVRREGILAYAGVVLRPGNISPLEEGDLKFLLHVLTQVQQKDPFIPIRRLVKMILARVPTVALASSSVVPRENSLPTSTNLDTITTSMGNFSLPARDKADTVVLPPQLQSKLYAWAAAELLTPSGKIPRQDDHDPTGFDPLSSEGQLTMQRSRNYACIRATATQLGLGEDDDIRHYGLHLRQSAVFNSKSEMTSLMVFHPYDRLGIC
ncbi:hypothetical protein DYB31_013387, partial [Aphanomyces astaci]